MKHLRTACVFAGLASGAGALAYAAPSANEPPPTAVYWVSASTTTGMMAQMMGSGGGRPSPQQMMAMMAHGGPPDPNAPQHSLRLQLGSLRHPAGPPAAEHDAPDGLGAGPVLPLLSPRPVAGPAPQQEEEGPRPPAQYHQPQGRMLIYWGCGEHAPPNQPLVIDFAHLADAPQRFAALMHGLNVPPMHGPSAGRYPSYGEWPNERNSDPIPAAGSLAGPHVVKGDYSPEIRFTLSPGQDFMPPLRLTSNTPMRSGAVQLAWDALPTATGYFATVMGAQRGGGGGETVVMWTSAERELAAFAAPDYISPGEARRLVGERAVLSPKTTNCVVPAEAAQAAQHGLLSMTAWGEEANFGYPARPQPPVWVVKVRYRSATSALLGQPNGFGGDQQRRNRPGFPGLGGLFPPH